MDWLDLFFAPCCGRDLGHTWCPGGLALPFCQRCTGLYLGALIAVVVQLGFRPPFTERRWKWETLCLLQMVPFGLHWLPQDALLRTLTGLLFGFGVVGYLWRLPAARLRFLAPAAPPRGRWSSGWVIGVTSVGMGGVLLTARDGGIAAAYVLAGLGAAGWLCLLILGMLDVGLLVLRPRRRR